MMTPPKSISFFDKVLLQKINEIIDNVVARGEYDKEYIQASILQDVNEWLEDSRAPMPEIEIYCPVTRVRVEEELNIAEEIPEVGEEDNVIEFPVAKKRQKPRIRLKVPPKEDK